MSAGEIRVEDPRLYWDGCRGRKWIGEPVRETGRDAKRDRYKTRKCTWNAREECFTG